MTDELSNLRTERFNRRVLRAVTEAGKPVTCAFISIGLGDWACDVRYALHTLIQDGLVHDVGGLYERVGNESGPEDAA